MQKFETIDGIAVPLMVADIETGLLAPSDWTQSNPFDLPGGLLRAWRYRADGSEDPDFVLNLPRYRNPKILLAGANFGCGSVRESAVWALRDFGIRCVIAPSFGENFRENAFQNGLLTLALDAQVVSGLASALHDMIVPVARVDLLNCTVQIEGRPAVSFEIPRDRRAALLEGLDDTALIRRFDAEIAAFRLKDRAVRPWIYLRTG